LWGRLAYSNHSLAKGEAAFDDQGSLMKRAASAGLANASKWKMFVVSSWTAAWASSGKAFILARASLGSDEKRVGIGPAQSFPSQALYLAGNLS